MKKLIIISGPTASGKTSYSIKIADEIQSKTKLKPVIINFDSLLFYKELNIGTAKPTTKERGGHPHLLIDLCSAKEPMNAHDYIQLAEEKILSCHKKGEIPILVGGSAFYLRALIKGMYESTKVSEESKQEVDQLYKAEGIKPFIDFLEKKDPETMKILHENDHYRIIRAYEHIIQTGQPFSLERKRMEALNPYDLSNGVHQDWELHHIFLDLPKEEHWSYITRRTKKMKEDGLVEEVKYLLSSGFTGEEKPLKSIGYVETLDFINSKFESEDDYLERISISTRQLAKSQRTFFKKITPKNSYHPIQDEEKILSEALEFTRV